MPNDTHTDRMNARLWPVLALTWFAALGNGQDGAVPPPPPDGYGIQGNATWTKALADSELAKAALAARQKKALMDSMATMAHKPPVITSAEQYLAVHRPPSPAPGEVAPAPARRDTYVPQFEAAPARTGRSPATASAPELPEKRGGLFGLFRPKERDPGSAEMAPPPAAYPEPPAAGIAPDASLPPSPPVPDPGTPGAAGAVSGATRGAAPAERPSLFGRLFGKEKTTEPSWVGEPTLPVAPSDPVPAPPPAESPAPSVPGGIPTPPAFDSPAPPVPPGDTEDATIFVRREAGGSASLTAKVLTESQATVDGVLVRLYEGTDVTVLERQGSMARIRLPDQREGIIAASALSR